MKLAGYVRVSTKDQDYTGQIEAINKWASAYNHEVTFFKEKVSALDENRQEFDRMTEKLDMFDGIVISSLDRLGRSTNQLTGYIKTLQEKKKELIVLDRNIDTSKVEGRFLLNILCAVTELERDIIYERMEAGKRRARERGVKFGRKKKELPAGAIKDYLDGGSYTKLAKDYNISKTTLVDGFNDLGILRRNQKR